MITVSVPGKVHLMGEHAVVYGYPALLAAINKRLTVSVDIDETQKNTLIIHAPEGKEYISHAVKIVQSHVALSDIPGMTITVQSDILPGYHLGSSAAVAVATVGAVLFALKRIWNPHLINQLAYEVEKKQHGTPSGGDNTSVSSGGFLWFRKELEFLKSMWQLSVKLSDSMDHFYLVNTGRPTESTGDMVAYVRTQKELHPSLYDKLFRKNEQAVKRVATAIHEEDEHALIHAIQDGEKTLEQIGVVSKRVQPFIRAVQKSGGAAKILGGGGRGESVGFLLVYHPEEREVHRISAMFGYPTERVRLGAEGVRLEKGSGG